jgi:uncharacterized metal-binding protein YceD (DUF177 family)
MSDILPISAPVRAADVAGRRDHRFDIAPDAEARRAIAALLGLAGLERLHFAGVLRPAGSRDVALSARLDAVAVQPSVVSLEPVSQPLGVDVQRLYVAGMEMPDAGEVEMPEDDTAEPLPDVIDLGAVMVEALALALPDYPRLPGEELGEAVFAPPGTAPLRDADLSPFAALSGLQLIAGGRDGAEADSADKTDNEDDPDTGGKGGGGT